MRTHRAKPVKVVTFETTVQKLEAAQMPFKIIDSDRIEVTKGDEKLVLSFRRGQLAYTVTHRPQDFIWNSFFHLFKFILWNRFFSQSFFSFSARLCPRKIPHKPRKHHRRQNVPPRRKRPHNVKIKQNTGLFAPSMTRTRRNAGQQRRTAANVGGTSKQTAKNAPATASQFWPHSKTNKRTLRFLAGQKNDDCRGIGHGFWYALPFFQILFTFSAQTTFLWKI